MFAAVGGISLRTTTAAPKNRLARYAAASVLSLMAVASSTTGAQSAALEKQIYRLEKEVEQLEAARAVKHLQRAYGYYTDRALWDDVADLFAPDGAIELGADGVYAGRERIREYLRRLGDSRIGLPWGRLAEHYQLQPVVHVAADGLSAKARWRDFALLGEYGKSASWGEGIYENEYVKRDGVWMIRSLHLYVTYVVPFEQGWARLRQSAVQRSKVAEELPSDRPPSRSHASFPGTDIAPFHYERPARQKATERYTFSMGELNEPDPRIAAYARQAQQLAAHDEIENLQGIYGYYFDQQLWDDVVRLFSDGAMFEHGQLGVYVGRKRIRQALELLAPAGPKRGWLNNYFQLQPVIHVAEDGRTAKARWQGLLQLTRPNASGVWGLGVYENEYVNERGVWKIHKLHFYTTALADYDLMWTKGPIPVEGASNVLPPDRPPSELYRSLPGVYLPPFHYAHPVTGKPIVTSPQPADSILRPQ